MNAATSANLRSSHDLVFTALVARAARLVEVEILGHLIVGLDGVPFLKATGALPGPSEMLPPNMNETSLDAWMEGGPPVALRGDYPGNSASTARP